MVRMDSDRQTDTATVPLSVALSRSVGHFHPDVSQLQSHYQRDPSTETQHRLLVDVLVRGVGVTPNWRAAFPEIARKLQ
jgi:hypothetical protein